MSVIRLYDDQTMQERDVVVPDDVADEVFRMVFKDALWKQLLTGDVGPELVERLRMRHRRWTARMRDAMATPPDADAILEKARALRAQGASWRDTAAATGINVTTLRRRLEAQAA